MRSGHTEAAIDLVRLAGLHPAGAICELVNDDGKCQARAAGDELRARARVQDHLGGRSHCLPQSRERLVEQVAQFDVETTIGTARGYSM